MRHQTKELRQKAKNGAIATACALALCACATTPAGKQAAAPRIDRQAESQAQAFEAFMRRARAIDPTFTGPAEVARGLSAGAAYDPKTLEAGMIAYAALAALEEPRFVAGVRKAGRDKDLAKRLMARPDLADDLPGGQAAAARASAALFRQGEPLAAEGRLVKTSAYGIQRQAWARAMVADPRGRLERVKQNASYRPATTAPNSTRPWPWAAPGAGHPAPWFSVAWRWRR
jgi:hypothetical protein